MGLKIRRLRIIKILAGEHLVHGLEEYLPHSLSRQERVAMFLPELVRGLQGLLRNPMTASECAPLLWDLFGSVELLRMQEGGEREEEACQRFIEAVANLRGGITMKSRLPAEIPLASRFP